MTTPNRHIPYVPESTLDPAAGTNLALNFIDALLQTGVVSMDLNSPPASPISDGEMYIVGETPTDEWALHARDLARYVEEGDFWQFFEAGTEVILVLNQEDGGFYKFVTGSPGNWTLAAGLDDAPNDGESYFRRDGAWQLYVPASIEPTDGSPDTPIDLGALMVGPEFRVTEGSPGAALLQFRGSQVVTTAADNVTATPDNASQYTRFSDDEATYTFSGAEAYEIGAEYHGRYIGTGTLTIVETGGMVVNAPRGGTLIIPSQGTFTVKIVAADEADLIGVTEDA